MRHLLLGLDIGSSSIKASLVDASVGQSIASFQSPSEEMSMISTHPGWAEQEPEQWWKHMVISVKSCLQKASVKAGEVKAIGISYQMHGLVVVDRSHEVLRPSIIWCDSRAVSIGQEATEALGEEYCLRHFLNAPGNFTASKLKWVRDHEPDLFEKIHKIMLPGDYIAMRLSGDIVTTDTGLSEGIFWDYENRSVSGKLLDYYGIPEHMLPPVVPVFAEQGRLSKSAAAALGLTEGVVIAYRSGDQPNNAFSLNVLNPGETAATAGTSGVIYSVTEKDAYDPKSRVNTFIHVNNTRQARRNGVLLCINGTGILNSWLRRNTRGAGNPFEYDQMNHLAQQVPPGAEGLMILPFGNGAERILQNRTVNASFHGLDFNHHSEGHLYRAAQEGIVFALKYGFDILRQMGLESSVIRAGNANMFLSPVFREAFVNTINAPLELYNTDGATGAALGAGVGAGVFDSPAAAFKGLKTIRTETPTESLAMQYETAYTKWKLQLNQIL